MKKNLKNLLALVLTGAMLSAGTAVFAETEPTPAPTSTPAPTVGPTSTPWDGTGKGEGTLTSSGQTVSAGTSAIKVVLPSQADAPNMVIDPDGLLSSADIDGMTVNGTGSVMFAFTDDGDNVLSDQSGNIPFQNKSALPINLTIEASANTAKGNDSNIKLVTTGSFSESTSTVWIKKADKSIVTSDPSDDTNYDKVEGYIAPQLELTVGVENNAEKAVADATTDATKKTTVYGLIPDASEYVIMQKVNPNNPTDYQFTMTYDDVADEDWPVLNVYVKGQANSGANWDAAIMGNFELTLKYTLETATTAATYNTAKDTKAYSLALDGFEKTTEKIRVKALSGGTDMVGQEVEYNIAELSGFVTPAANKVTLTAETMGILKDVFGGDQDAKLVIAGSGSKGKIVTIK